MDILFTSRKLPSIHSESVPRSMSKTSTHSYTATPKKKNLQYYCPSGYSKEICYFQDKNTLKIETGKVPGHVLLPQSLLSGLFAVVKPFSKRQLLDASKLTEFETTIQ